MKMEKLLLVVSVPLSSSVVQNADNGITLPLNAVRDGDRFSHSKEGLQGQNQYRKQYSSEGCVVD